MRISAREVARERPRAGFELAIGGDGRLLGRTIYVCDVSGRRGGGRGARGPIENGEGTKGLHCGASFGILAGDVFSYEIECAARADSGREDRTERVGNIPPTANGTIYRFNWRGVLLLVLGGFIPSIRLDLSSLAQCVSDCR